METLQQTIQTSACFALQLVPSREVRFPRDEIGAEDLVLLRGASGGEALASPAHRSRLLHPDSRIAVRGRSSRLEIEVETPLLRASTTDDRAFLTLYLTPAARTFADRLACRSWSWIGGGPTLDLGAPARS